MGSRMARRLVDAGHDVTVWNRSADRTRPLVEAGATAAVTPADAASSADVVLTMVADPPALRAVTEGENGVIAGLADGATLIEMSTVGPPAIARLSSLMPVGAGLLDAPVLGSLAEAESGSLRIFMGGPAPLADRWRPLLSVLGSPVHVGPLGSGAAAKLVANSTLFGVLGVLGEAVALADGLGLSREATYEVLAASPLAAQAERRRAALEGEEQPTRFALSLAVKDERLVTEAAAAAGVDLRLAPAALSWLVAAEAAGLGDGDYSAVLIRILGKH
jgi:3-hydroxyisobutyrate dehydrogenase-like beta-hydroxyacid dehydrogenase